MNVLAAVGVAMQTVTCPICQKQMEVRQVADWPSFPFCSPRCRLIDLGRWLGGDYRIPDASTDVSPDGGPPIEGGP